MPSEEKMAKQIPVEVARSTVENTYSTTGTEGSRSMEELANGTNTKTSEVVGNEGTLFGNLETQSKIPQTLFKAENESVGTLKEEDTVKTTQLSVARPGSRKLPGLTKMLESDTESLQLDATVSNEDSDDFDFSSDK